MITLLDSELPTGSAIETHTIFVMHHGDPNSHAAHLGNITTQGEWNSGFATYGWYAYPFWSFWEVTTGANNYGDRNSTGTGSAFVGTPPVETFRN